MGVMGSSLLSFANGEYMNDGAAHVAFNVAEELSQKQPAPFSVI